MRKHLLGTVVLLGALSLGDQQINATDIIPMPSPKIMQSLSIGNTIVSPKHLMVLNSRSIDTNQIMKERYSIEEEKEYEYDIKMTFYTILDSENGWGPIDALENPLEFGTVAIPKDFPLGSKWEFENYPNMVFNGTDTGSKINMEGNTVHVDICIEREPGEDDDQYWERVNAMGVVYTRGNMISD